MRKQFRHLRKASFSVSRSSFLSRFTEILLLALFSIPALSPLLTTVPTRSADGLLHLYRLVQLDTLWHNGIFFTRWLPDLAYGYGMPLFNYYAPLVYYITTPLHWFGISFPLALNLSLASAMFVGAVGMFYFSRALVGELIGDIEGVTPAALIAALAFLYSPYILFNALDRANVAEEWALALTPFALWRFFVLIQKPNPLNWGSAVMTFAAVMLSHNVTSFLFAPLLLGFIAASTLAKFSGSGYTPANSNSKFGASATQIYKFALPLFAFLLALLLSSFFWLPALLERDFVQIARVIVTPDFDYRFNFVPLTELVAFLPSANTGLMNPSFPSTLGVVQVVLALVGIYVLVTRWRSRRALPLAALVLGALGFVALMLAVSQPLWDSISLLSFVQLPMRLRGLVALTLAPLIGASIFVLPQRGQTAGTLLAIAAIVLSALSLLYPRYAADVPPNPTLSDMFAYEQASGALGTTSFGEYLPVWVQNPPDKSPFADTYARGESPDRLVIPEGVTLCGSAIQPTTQTICTASSDSWHAVFQSFYFPGFQVSLDGKALEATPTPRTGLISFDVPTGGTLTVQYIGTVIENFSNWLSLATIVLVLGITSYALVRLFRHRASNLQPTDSSSLHPSFSLSASPLLLLALALVVFKLGYTDHLPNPFVAHYDGRIDVRLEDAPFSPVNFGDELQLLNFSTNAVHRLGNAIPTAVVKPGQTFTLTLYWRALSPLQRNLSTFAHLTTIDGTILAQKDNLHPANLPTTRWDTDGYVADEHTFQIPSKLVPGQYELHIGVYDPRTTERLKPAPCCDDDMLLYILVE